MSKYKIGDRVRIMSGGYSEAEGFKNGDIFVVTKDTTRQDGGGFIHGTCPEMGDMIFFLHEVEPVVSEVASITLDIPTEAMKEFVDHCERAAAALERIKAALA